MEHNLFKPATIEEAKHCVVGNCNGFTMQQRWDLETPLFARAILSRFNGGSILDYGCGVGRLSKAILDIDSSIDLVGTDASSSMMSKALNYVDSESFSILKPDEIDHKFDLIYCIYVLQHVPSIEIREILQRIYDNLKDDGVFIYCSSDYRMAIRFDGGGFFDDRFLGVDLQPEIERYFEKIDRLFTEQVLKDNPILDKMINGDSSGLPHPAYVYRKKKISGKLYNAAPKEESSHISRVNQQIADLDKKLSREYTRLVLINRLAPGDILVMTNVLRDLHKAYPGKYLTEVRSPCNAIFDNNPYITKLDYNESEYQKEEQLLHAGDRNGHTFVLNGDILCIDMHYPIIHTSGESGWHFGYGHTDWLEEVLKIKIPKTSIRPEIYLSQSERDWISPVLLATGDDSPYWVINAGSKGDYTLKQYHRYQEVVDLLKGKIRFVQIGLKNHTHVPLDGVIDMIGKTNDTRKIMRVINSAQGVLTCVSFPMHIAAALSKPCVVVAGGREGTRWELYPNQQFLYVNGCLPCAPYDGCWKSKFEDCTNKVNNIAKCMTMITPSDIKRAIERYYDGGMLEY